MQEGGTVLSGCVARGSVGRGMLQYCGEDEVSRRARAGSLMVVCYRGWGGVRGVDIRRAGAACPPGPAPSVPRSSAQALLVWR